MNEQKERTWYTRKVLTKLLAAFLHVKGNSYSSYVFFP